jgi:DNA-binding NarL/FixJ family response regulator
MPPIRVLVVDDTAHVRNMLTSMLVLDGFEVTGSLASGTEAVAQVEALDPDVVIIDYKMPGMDGIETARRLRAQRPSQVMVMYTAFVDARLQQEAAAVGVSVCLGKVEGLASLEREISRLCTSLF